MRAAHGRTLLAASVTRARPALKRQLELAQAAGADLVELRADLIGDLSAVEAALRRPRPLPVILTLRSAAEGGAWSGAEHERIATLLQLGALRPDYIDIEWATWRRSGSLRRKLRELCRLPVASNARGAEHRPSVGRPPAAPRLILSHHTNDPRPRRLPELLACLSAGEAHVVKAAFCAHDATDALRALAAASELHGRDRLILVAAGLAGLCTRVLAPKFGLFATFACLRAGSESATGQPTLAIMRERYRWAQVDAATRVFGVVGWPVTHSASPLVHNAALHACGINAVYLPFPVRPGYRNLVAYLELLTAWPELNVTGLSVTQPHKENVLRWLEARGQALDGAAQRCRAVNTLTRRQNGTWLGSNTDLVGFREAVRCALLARGIDLAGRRVAVLGAGGVARAVAAALQELGCCVVVYGQTERRARRLARELACQWRPWSERSVYEAEVLVNCTPVGMSPEVRATPLPDVAIRPGTVVVDTIYDPPATRLQRAARRRGCVVLGGREMFIRQAVAQFEAWHRCSAPLDIMRRAASERC